MSKNFPKKPEFDAPAPESEAESITPIPVFQPPTSSASMVEVVFLESHTHITTKYNPGDRLLVPKHTADWLITNKRAKIA